MGREKREKEERRKSLCEKQKGKESEQNLKRERRIKRTTSDLVLQLEAREIPLTAESLETTKWPLAQECSQTHGVGWDKTVTFI